MGGHSRTWRAAICFKGKRHYLGSYILFENAVKARKREKRISTINSFVNAPNSRQRRPTADSNRVRKEAKPMTQAVSPWHCPAAIRAIDGGSSIL